MAHRDSRSWRGTRALAFTRPQSGPKTSDWWQAAVMAALIFAALLT
jgi:hypothetical protein